MPFISAINLLCSAMYHGTFQRRTHESEHKVTLNSVTVNEIHREMEFLFRCIYFSYTYDSYYFSNISTHINAMLHMRVRAR